MAAQWTADVIGEMHLHKITKKRLAEAMSVTPEYISMVLHGHREPAGAESRFRDAVAAIIADKIASDGQQSICLHRTGGGKECLKSR